MGEGLDLTLIRERMRMTPSELADRAVLEWERTAPLRRGDDRSA